MSLYFQFLLRKTFCERWWPLISIRKPVQVPLGQMCVRLKGNLSVLPHCISHSVLHYVPCIPVEKWRLYAHTQPLSTGVLQGPVLGPFVFLPVHKKLLISLLYCHIFIFLLFYQPRAPLYTHFKF